MKRISVVGLGKLGQGLAASFASRGFTTLGVDIDERVVASINSGRASVVEPQLQELITAAGPRFRATTSHVQAVNETDVTFVLVATPSDSDGNFSTRYVEAAMRSLGAGLRESGKPYHLFVVNSTLTPGSMNERLIPLLEETSGRRVNEGFGICYCPETVALGNVVNGFLKPDMIILGACNEEAAGVVRAIYERLCEAGPPVFVLSLINAELAKVALNCYITTKISFANLLANVCESIPGGDVDEVTRAIGADRRIGSLYLRGGLSYGGTCFPRDTRAFIALARSVDRDPGLIEAVDAVNDEQHRHLAQTVKAHAESVGTQAISILGLAFKPDTPVMVESPAARLIESLLEWGFQINAYDPLALDEAEAMFGSRVRYFNSIPQCVKDTGVCVITTMAREFTSLQGSDLGKSPLRIIDCWRILDPTAFGKHIDVVALGRAAPQAALSALAE